MDSKTLTPAALVTVAGTDWPARAPTYRDRLAAAVGDTDHVVTLTGWKLHNGKGLTPDALDEALKYSDFARNSYLTHRAQWYEGTRLKGVRRAA